MDGDEARRVLGVGDHASRHDVRRAFRARARGTHPDRGGDRRAFERLVTARAALLAAETAATPVAMLGPRPTIDCYDSPPRPRPTRTFADVLHSVRQRVAG
jgi:hypothetical protein